MKYTELTDKSNEELSTLLVELREKLSRLRFSLADKNLKDSSQISKLRRDIARINTVLSKTNDKK